MPDPDGHFSVITNVAIVPTVGAETFAAPALTAPKERASPLASSPARELRELTAAVRAGESAAFTELYNRFSLRLYTYLLVLAKGDEVAAREVLQAVVMKMAR